MFNFTSLSYKDQTEFQITLYKPCNADANPADWTCARSVLKSLSPATISTIFPVGGVITLSMTWITPFDAPISKDSIVDPSTVTAY